MLDSASKKSHIPGDFLKIPQSPVKPFFSFLLRHAKEVMSTCLLASDVISLLAAFGLAVLLRSLFLGGDYFSFYLKFLPYLFLFILVYAWRGWYPGVGLSPVDEMSLIGGVTSTLFLALVALTFLGQSAESFSRYILITAWLLEVVLVQSDRWLVRILGRRLDFWGEPVIIVGDGPNEHRIFEYLVKNIRLGMRPVCLVG
jgi:FlaA1/EpsC-like NDP-sugar epimerase